MTLNRAPLLIGLLAGVATALLALSAGTPSSLSFFLLSSATLPILIASLGWGDLAGVLAIAVACLVIALGVSPLVAVMFLATSLAPAAWIGHLANLSRPAEELGGAQGTFAWYPLSGIMLHLCVLVTIGLIVLGVVVGYGNEIAGYLVDAFVEVMKQQNPSYQPDAAAVTQMKAFFVHALPAVQGAAWVTILFTSFYVAAAIVRASGGRGRPRDDIPASLRMPRRAVALFVVGLVLVFLGGVPAFIGSAACGAFAAGFMLSGFALLHERTRGWPWRFATLWLAYFAVVLFTVPLVFFLLAGLLEAAGAMPARRPGPHDKT